MLRKIRITLAVICFALITLLLLDFTGTLHTWFGWLARIQFLPAVLALNVTVVASLVVLTLLLGRVYCSVICPLGVFQDIVSWLSGRRRKYRYRFSYSPAKRWLRIPLSELKTHPSTEEGHEGLLVIDPQSLQHAISVRISDIKVVSIGSVPEIREPETEEKP